MYSRKCPKCNEDIVYTDIKNKKRNLNSTSTCKKCRLELMREKSKKIRKCPSCDKDIVYYNGSMYERDNLNKTCCKDCKKKIKNEYKRKCPKCNNEIVYVYKSTYDIANKRNTSCRSCRNKNKQKFNTEITNFKRKCPECNEDIFYKSQGSLDKAIKRNSACSQQCLNKKNIKDKVYFRTCPICNEEMLYPNKGSFSRAKKNNTTCSFQCKVKKDGKIFIRECPECKKDIEYFGLKYPKKAEKNKTLCRSCTTINQMKNKKPVLEGSSYGWSGYYKDYYFRSSLELSYLVYLVNNNVKFESGEKRKYSIPYQINGEIKDYIPDFVLLSTNEIIEIKFVKHLKLPENIAKFKYAKEKHGNNFKIITEKDINCFSRNDIFKMFLNNDIIFDKQSLEKYNDLQKGKINND